MSCIQLAGALQILRYDANLSVWRSEARPLLYAAPAPRADLLFVARPDRKPAHQPSWRFSTREYYFPISKAKYV
jgi:hypothetical protein